MIVNFENKKIPKERMPLSIKFNGEQSSWNFVKVIAERNWYEHDDGIIGGFITKKEKGIKFTCGKQVYCIYDRKLK